MDENYKGHPFLISLEFVFSFNCLIYFCFYFFYVFSCFILQYIFGFICYLKSNDSMICLFYFAAYVKHFVTWVLESAL